jgi:hypothetical protein
VRSPVWLGLGAGLLGFAIGWRLFELVGGWAVALSIPIGLTLGVFAFGVPLSAYMHRRETGEPLPPGWWKPGLRELWWWKR